MKKTLSGKELLPDRASLALLNVEKGDQGCLMEAVAGDHAVCPDCGVLSTARHSSYWRNWKDLPVQGQPVQLRLQVSRWRCRNRGCERRIFCPRWESVSHKQARETKRFGEVVRLIAYALGGRPGERLSGRLGLPVSDDTLLRRIKQGAKSRLSHGPISVVGVDDWAWRKGQAYGTILVNLELHRVIDLLPVRSVESLSEWLEQHPEIVAISRDRSGLYAEGAALGAPHAQQIADRFHLVLNLSSAMERVLEEHRRELILPPAEEGAPKAESACRAELGEVLPVAAPPQPKPSQERRQRRLERYEQVVARFQAGESQRAIGRALGLDRKTVRRWLRRGQFPERKAPHRPAPQVHEFAGYLQQRWKEGCHNASRLYREIRAQGYRGKRGMVAQFVAGWRKTGQATSPRSPQRIAPRHAAILVTRPAEKMTGEQRQLLDRIVGQCPEVFDLRQIALTFREALMADESTPLQQWIARAKGCQFGAVVRFAYGLEKDLSAVCAAVDTPWSSGQVEGQINRLKMIKRQMYGRAGFDLLRARVLPYSSLVSASRSP
jgi:transposase